MKEIISRRNKSPYVLALVLSLFSMAMSYIYLRSLGILAIALMSAMGFAAVVWTALLIDQRGVLVREGDKLIVVRGLWKTVLNISDLKGASRVPHQSKHGEFQKNCIFIIHVSGGKETKMLCSDVIDENSAIAKINALVRK